MDGTPKHLTLREILLHRADADSGRLAFAHRDEQLTFAELAERAESRAATLKALGARPGDRVAVQMSVGLALMETFWGLQLLGAVPCILNPSLPAPALARRTQSVRPRMVLRDGYERECAAGGPLGDTQVGPDDLAFLQLTSGTSGTPRASMILQRNVIAYLRLNRTNGFLSSADVLVSWVPPWHDLGLVRFVIGSVFLGASCHIVQSAIRTVPEWLQTISRARATYSAAPDFAARLAVRMVDPDTVDLSPLRLMKLGAEPIRRSTIERFERTFSVPGTVVPGYGLGEATLSVSEHLPGEEIPVDEHGNLSCGSVNPGLEVRTGRAAAPAEILVRGESVFAGYFEAAQETRKTLRDGWLHTGDLGYTDEHGRLFVLGRREGMIKRAGTVIPARELDEAAERVPGVRIASATAVTSVKDEETIVVAIETDGSSEFTDQQIAASVTKEIVASVGFAPGRVSVVPRRTIPRTENGKVRYGRLRQMLEAGL